MADGKIVIETGLETKGIEKDIKTVASKTKQMGEEVSKNTKVTPELKTEKLKTQIDSTTKSLDNTNAKIEQQQNKLKELKEDYSNCFNEARKNKLEEQILKTESSIISLTKKSDKLGFELADLDEEFEKLGKSASESADKIDKVSEKSKAGLTSLTGIASKSILAGITGIGTALYGVGALATKFGIEYQKAFNQLQASTGATREEMQGLSKVMKEIYGNNFGEDMNDIAKSMATVKQFIGGTSKQIQESIQDALGFRDTFGYDIPESIRAAKALMDNFGISSKEAFNLMAQGEYEGLDYSNELIDNISEYSVQFKKANLSAEDMFNIMKAGAQNGAWNLDKIGDAVKEFNIRLVDGSNTTKEGLKAIGMNSSEVAAKMSAGGEIANKTFKEVVNGLADMKDKAKQNIVGVSLFGTMWEDLGPQVCLQLANIDGAFDKTKNTMEEVNKIKFSDTGEALEGIGRQIQTNVFLPISDQILPSLNDMANQLREAFSSEEMQSSIQAISDSIAGLINNTASFISNELPSILAGFAWILNNGGNIASAVIGIGTALLTLNVVSIITDVIGVMKGLAATTSIVTSAQAALNIVMSLNPIGLVITLVAGLVAGLVVLYNTNDKFRAMCNNTWKEISQGAQKYLGGIITVIKKVVNGIKTVFTNFSWFSLGKFVAQGILNGLLGGLPGIIKTVSNIANSISKTFRNRMKIHSPSKVMQENGEYVVDGLTKGMKDKTKDVKEATQELADTVENNLNINKDKFTKFTEALVQAIKNRYEQEEEAQLKYLDSQLTAEEKASQARLKVYENEYNQKVKLYEDDTEARTKSLQDQIDAINKTIDEETKAEERKEHNQSIKTLKTKLNNTKSAADRRKLQLQIKNEEDKWNKKQLSDKRAEEKESLQQQINDLKDQLNDEKELLKEEYDTKKETEEANLKTIQESNKSQQEEVKSHYEELLKQDNINAEARKLILDDNQRAMLTLLETYNPKWQDAGQSLADSLLNGLNSEKQSMQDALSEALTLRNIIPEQETYLKSLKEQIEALNKAGSSGGGGISSEAYDTEGIETATSTVEECFSDLGESVEETTDSMNEDVGSFTGLIEFAGKRIISTINPGIGGAIQLADTFKSVFDLLKSSSSNTLDEMKEHFKSLDQITQDGFYSIKNTATGAMEDVYVTVDETTGEITGMWSQTSGECQGATDEMKEKVQQLGQEHVSTDTNIRQALNDMSGATINAKGEMVNAYGEVVGKLDEVTTHSDGTRTGILNLNGTPIQIETNADGTIKNIDDVRTAVNNVPVSHTITFEAIGKGFKQVAERIKNLAIGAYDNVIGGKATGDNFIQKSGFYNLHEHGWELSENGNVSMLGKSGNYDMGYVPRGTKIIPHMQSVNDMRQEVSRQVNSNMGDLYRKMKSTVDYETARMTAKIIEKNNQEVATKTSNVDSSTQIAHNGPLLHVEHMEVRNDSDIETLSKELGFYSKRKELYRK